MKDKRQSLKCVACGKDISYLWPASSDIENPDDAVSGVLRGGYGSCHDLTKFLIVICDSCIDKGLKGGTVIDRGEYSPMEGMRCSCPLPCKGC